MAHRVITRSRGVSVGEDETIKPLVVTHKEMRDLLNREEVICLVIENNRTHGLEMTAFEFAYDNGCAVNIKHRRYVPNVAVGEIVRYKHATRTVNRVSPIDDTDVSKARKPSRTGLYQNQRGPSRHRLRRPQKYDSSRHAPAFAARIGTD